jgi:Na+/proline symporter
MAVMNLRMVTIGIITAVAVLLIGYDILPFQTEVDHDTISEVMRDAGGIAAVPFAFAFLAGHFWFRPQERQLSHGAALGSAGAIAALLTWLLYDQDPTYTVPAVLVAGFVSGGYLWPLKPPPKLGADAELEDDGSHGAAASEAQEKEDPGPLD